MRVEFDVVLVNVWQEVGVRIQFYARIDKKKAFSIFSAVVIAVRENIHFYLYTVYVGQPS